MKTELNADIRTALTFLEGRRIAHVFLVACGGSLSIMYPGKYFLDRHSRTLSSDVYNADEFVCRDPAKLDANALVIVCSQTGTTQETVRAAAHAKSKGAAVVSMTLDPFSPLAETANVRLRYQASYTTGVKIDAADGNYGVLYSFLAGLIRLTDANDVVAPLLNSLGHLQKAIDRALAYYQPSFERFARRLADKPAIYTMASGASYGAAYSFAICVLMEMLRINSQAIHADEFFHGPFEVVDREAAFILLVGLDETRRLELRAKDFLFRFATKENIFVLDAADLDLDGIDDRFKGYLAPLIFFDTLWKFAYELAAKRNQIMLDGRRYMKKISDY